MSASSSSQLVKAYDLLASQPVSSSDLSRASRDNIIVSAIIGADGEEHVLSRLGDDRWDLRPFFSQANAVDSQKIITWPKDCPTELVADCKSVIYAWFKRGLKGSRAPIARTIFDAVVGNVIPVMRWLKSLGVTRVSQITPLYISNYAHLSKGEVRPNGVYDRLLIFDLLWIFRDETTYCLSKAPWGKSTRWRVSGTRARGGSGKTPIIPPDVQAKVFNYCEKILADAPATLTNRKVALGERASALVRVRDAALYIISITSGMRNDEVIGIESRSWRTEMRRGIPFHWVSTIEHKTKKGMVEYLVPHVALAALETLTNYAQPLQKRLEEEIERLNRGDTSLTETERLIRLHKAKSDRKKLFLAVKGKTDSQETRIEAISGAACQRAFARLAKEAEVEWDLLPHQCRRTYARMIVESRMGRKSLVFLKWQLKHTSISMSELYASNPNQDATIFDDILEEMIGFKSELIESWLDDRPLAGGAGRKLTKLRAIPVKSRKHLLSQTATQIHIRATGHAWCLAEERGCGGAGLYEATRCGDCKSGVIDESFVATWQGIFDQQKELLELTDVGPAVLQRARSDLRISAQVLQDLGVPRDEELAKTDNHER